MKIKTLLSLIALAAFGGWFVSTMQVLATTAPVIATY